MHIRVINSTASPYSVSQLMADNPNTSFPEVLSDAILAQWDVYPLHPAAPPPHDPMTQNVTIAPLLVGGVWTQVWTVSTVSHAEVEQRIANLAANMRADRDSRLAACDWIAIRAAETMTIIPPEWMAYRQALRDIAEQPGFPAAVAWPDKPE